MGDATVTCGRGESRTAFEGTFGAESRQEIRRLGAPPDEGYDEGHQGEEHEQKSDGDEKEHQA